MLRLYERWVLNVYWIGNDAKISGNGPIWDTNQVLALGTEGSHEHPQNKTPCVFQVVTLSSSLLTDNDSYTGA